MTALERAPAPGPVAASNGTSKDLAAGSGSIISATNLTILNFILVWFGPLHEQTLCLALGAVQVAGSALAFGIRYGVGSLVYGGDRR